ncbi:hypothetical protein AB1K70_19860 [Bremerella sp. JC770]|uniref:hypothetical protein n=1 Tax=Bremerella sp. JC770 TaxID=3232137 RepID=UPI003458D8CE
MHREAFRWPVCRMLGILSLLFWTGCIAGNHDGRTEVRGSVVMDDLPLATGKITLIPVGEGVAAGGDIVNGTYHIPPDIGPTPGDYLVEIYSFAAIGKKRKDTLGNAMVDIPENIIPECYNSKTKLRVTIADQSNKHDFALASDAS